MSGHATGRIATLLLAAGRSSRMGEDHKLLAAIEGRSVIEWTVGAAVEADAGPVLVVTGHRSADVEELLPGGVTVVHNERWQDGMASSLQAGIAALPDAVDAVAVVLADMPALRAEHVRAVTSAWSAGRIVVPTCGGRRGHPVVWPSSLFPAFDDLRGDTGAKPLLLRHADAVDEVAVDDPGILLDVDDEAGLLRAARMLRERAGVVG